MADNTDPKPDTSTEGKNGGEGKGKDDPDPKPENTPKFTQADLDRIAGEARKSEREKAKREKEEEDKARQEAADKEAGKHKELAAKFEKERDDMKSDLDALQTKHDALCEKLTAIVEADIKALPEELRSLAPSSLEDRLEWLPKAKTTAAKLERDPAPGNPKGPRSTGTNQPDAVKDAIARKRASGKYAV